MLGYECPKCGLIKRADGKGCDNCGTSWEAMKIVSLDKNGKKEKPNPYNPYITLMNLMNLIYLRTKNNGK